MISLGVRVVWGWISQSPFTGCDRVGGLASRLSFASRTYSSRWTPLLAMDASVDASDAARDAPQLAGTHASDSEIGHGATAAGRILNVVGELALNMNRAWAEMEMEILRHYAETSACHEPLILVANGLVKHRGGAVHRRLRDALYTLTALCRQHPRAHLLTLFTDPMIGWPQRREFEKGNLKWPSDTDFTRIDLALLNERPPLVISVFRRLGVVPHKAVWAICYHRLIPPPTITLEPEPDFDEWRSRRFDVAYVGNDRSVLRRKCNALFLADPRLATLTHGLSSKHCEAWPNHVAQDKVAMEDVALVHERARFSLVTCDPRHASWEVGCTIRVVQGLHGSSICAFHRAYPAEFLFHGLPNGELGEELMLRGPDELVYLLQTMTAERYAAFVRLQRLAARRLQDIGASEDPISRLLEAAGATAHYGAQTGHRELAREAVDEAVEAHDPAEAAEQRGTGGAAASLLLTELQTKSIN